jgi:hypothetical protein
VSRPLVGAGRFPAPSCGLPYLLFRTTPRDRWLLAMIAEHRVLTAEQITTLAYTSLRSANRRLASLTGLRLLERFRTNRGVDGAIPYHYILGPAGALLVAAAHDLTPKEFGYDRARLLRQATRADLPHTDGCNTLMIQLAAVHRHDPADQLLAWWDQDSCTRVWGDAIRPDAYGVYQHTTPDGGTAVCSFFLEYDTGSEPLGRVTAKVRGYRRYGENYTGHRPILIHLHSAQREEHLHNALANLAARTDPAARCPVPIATTSASPDRVHTAVWRPAGTRQRLALAELPALFETCGYRMLPAVLADPALTAPPPTAPQPTRPLGREG